MVVKLVNQVQHRQEAFLLVLICVLLQNMQMEYEHL